MSGETWYSTSWLYRVMITIPAASLTGNLSAFPVYVNLGDLPAGFHSHVNADGSDIRVTASDGVTELAREVVFYSSGAGELYVKLDLSTAADNIIYIYYGNSGASNYADSDMYGTYAVWSAFAAVYHLQEGGTTAAGGYKDSTGNASGTGVGNVATANPAKIGIGTTFDGNNDYINIGNGAGLKITGNLSLVAYIKGADYGAQRAICSKISSSIPAPWDFMVTNSPARLRFVRGNGSSFGELISTVSLSTNVWYRVGASHVPGGTCKLYNNGAVERTANITTAIADGNKNCLIGNRDGLYPDWNGALDEVYVAAAILTPEWYAADALNKNTPTSFYAVGSEESGFAIQLEDLSLDIAAYYQALEDIKLWVGSTDGTVLEDMLADLAAYFESSGDNLPVWLGAAYENMENLKTWLGTLAEYFGDLKTDLSVRGQNVEDLNTWIGMAKEFMNDLSACLGVTDGTVLNDLAVWLGVTDGNTFEDMRVWVGVISAIPAFRSVTAHRVSSVIHEVV